MPASKYKSAKELQLKIDEYIEICTGDPEKQIPMTFTGLAYHLGFCERRSLNDYAKRKDELSTPIKRAMLRIEQSYEEALRGNNSTGSIFALKNRGWTDKQEVQLSGDDKKPIRMVSISEIMGK